MLWVRRRVGKLVSVWLVAWQPIVVAYDALGEEKIAVAESVFGAVRVVLVLLLVRAVVVVLRKKIVALPLRRHFPVLL